MKKNETSHLQARATAELLVSMSDDHMNGIDQLGQLKEILEAEGKYQTVSEKRLDWCLMNLGQSGYYLYYLIIKGNTDFISCLAPRIVENPSFGSEAQKFTFSFDRLNFMHIAAQYATNPEMFNALRDIINHALKQNPGLMFNADNTAHKNTPLLSAVRHNNPLMVNYLLEYFCNNYDALDVDLKEAAFNKLYVTNNVNVYDMARGLYDAKVNVRRSNTTAKQEIEISKGILKTLYASGVPFLSKNTNLDLHLQHEYVFLYPEPKLKESPLVNIQNFRSCVLNEAQDNDTILIQDKEYWQKYLNYCVRGNFNSQGLRTKFLHLYQSLSVAEESIKPVDDHEKILLDAMSRWFDEKDSELLSKEWWHQRTWANPLRIMADAWAGIDEESYRNMFFLSVIRLSLFVYGFIVLWMFTHAVKEKYFDLQRELHKMEPNCDFMGCWASFKHINCAWGNDSSGFSNSTNSSDFNGLTEEVREVYRQCADCAPLAFGLMFVSVLGGIFILGPQLAFGVVMMFGRDVRFLRNWDFKLFKAPAYLLQRIFGSYLPENDIEGKQILANVLQDVCIQLMPFCTDDTKREELSAYVTKLNSADELQNMTLTDLHQVMTLIKPLLAAYSERRQLIPKSVEFSEGTKKLVNPIQKKVEYEANNIDIEAVGNINDGDVKIRSRGSFLGWAFGGNNNSLNSATPLLKKEQKQSNYNSQTGAGDRLEGKTRCTII